MSLLRTRPRPSDADADAVATAPVRWLTVVLPPLLVVLAALLSVGLHVRAYTLVGPIDELQHIDYLYKSPDVVAPGDRVDDEAMAEEACRGLDYPGFELPPCEPGGDYEPDDFQESGYNTASANTPLYYTITHALAAPILWLTPIDSLVTAGRLVGGLWLAAGLLLAYAAARRLGAGRWATAAVLVVLACVPAIVYPSSTITPDAATFAVGAGALLAALWWEERPGRRWWVLAVVTAVALAMKMTNITVLVAIGIYMLVRLLLPWWHARRGRASDATAPVDDVAAQDGVEPSPAARAEIAAATATDDPGTRVTARQWLVGGGTLAATALVVAVGWLVVQEQLTHGDLDKIPMNQLFRATALSLPPLVGFLGSWLTPLSSAWAAVGRPELTEALQRLGGLLLSAGFLAAAVIGFRPLRERVLAWATVLTGLTGASAFIVLSFYAQSLYVPPPARYGYALVPAMAVLTAAGLRTRLAVVATGALAVVAVVFSVLRLV